MTRSNPAPSHGLSIRFASLAVVMAIALVSLATAWQVTVEDGRADALARFERRIERIQSGLVARLRNYELGLICGRALFCGSHSVERHEWRAFVETCRLDTVLAASRGFAFIEHVEPERLDEFLDEVRADGAPDFDIHWGRFAPPEDGRAHHIIRYHEPERTNATALGFDSAVNPESYAAMCLARDSGRSAMTGRVTLVQGDSDESAVVMYVPTYRNGAPLHTIEERRAAISGWIAAPIIIRDLLTEARDDAWEAVAVAIYDGPASEPTSLLYGEGAEMSSLRGVPRPWWRLHRSAEIPFGGRIWTVQAAARPGAPWNEWRLSALTTLGVGVVMSVLLAGVTWMLTSMRARAVAAAERMTVSLRESEERFERSIRGTAEGLWDWEIETGRVWYAPRFRDLLGYAHDDPAFPDRLDAMLEHLHPDDRNPVMDAVQAHLEDAEPFDIDYRLRVKNGGYRWFHARGQAERDMTGRAIMMSGSIRDITDERRAEEERDALQRRAGMADVATNVLHNVGNVLNSVSVSADLVAGRLRRSRIGNVTRVANLLREHDDDLGEFVTRDDKGRRLPEFLTTLAEHLAGEQHELLEEIETLDRSLGHIRHIISAQQAYATGAQMVDSIDIASVIDEAISMNRARLERAGVVLEREIAPVGHVLADRHKVLEILVNLISNAATAAQALEGSSRLVRVRLETDEAGCHALIRVIDRGIGIARDDLDRIFQQGFTTRDDGHGFGLHSAAIAAQQMRGNLTARSDGPGCGAEFRLQLPLTPDPARFDAAPSVPDQEEPSCPTSP